MYYREGKQHLFGATSGTTRQLLTLHCVCALCVNLSVSPTLPWVGQVGLTARWSMQWVGSTRRDRGYLKRQTRDAREALISAYVEKGESCHPTHPHPRAHPHPHPHPHPCIRTNVYILYIHNEYTHPTNLACLRGGAGGKGRSG